MASDDEDVVGLEQPPKRQKRFTFQRFAQRVAQVNVNVYGSLGKVRTEPLPGSSSFFQEQVGEWRELNSTAAWLEVASVVNPLAQSLPLLLHHQAQIVQILLDALKLEHALSLPPVLHLLSCLARDLQQDFLPYIPRLLAAIMQLVDSGANRNPELLQDVFTSLSNTFRHLTKHIAAQLPSLLHSSIGLRYSPAQHVRKLAADSFGYLFRHSSQSGLKLGVKAVLAEAALQPCPERHDGAGRVLAAAVKGSSQGLHSRAKPLLDLLLQEDLLTPDHFSTHQRARAESTRSQELLRASAAAVICVAVEQLLNHVQKEKAGTLWDCLLTAADSRVKACNRTDVPQQSNCSSSARAVAFVAQCIEFHHGSRVEDFQPAIQLTTQLAKPELLAKAAAAAAAAVQAPTDDTQFDASSAVHGDDLDFAAPSLSQQTLRLMQAIVSAHEQDGGQGQGLPALTRAAAAWAPLFAHAPITEVLPCIASLIKPPLGSPAVAQLFGPHLLAAAGRAVLSGDAPLVQLGMPLLVDLCSALRPSGSSAQLAALPVVLTAAHQQGLKMAGFFQSIIQSWPKPPALSSEGETNPSSGVALVWAAVQCLPHADSNPQHSIKLLKGLISATETALKTSLQSDDSAVTSGQAQEVLFLQCYARGTLASLLDAHAPEQLQQQAGTALNLLYQHANNYHVVRCAAEVVTLAKKAGCSFPTSQLQEVVQSMGPALSAPSQAMRVATLRLLCCFEQPQLTSGAAPAGTSQTSQVFTTCLTIQTQPFTSDSGRQAAVAIGRLRNQLEYKQVPSQQVVPVVRCLIGIMHIRFSRLWTPCVEALAAALEFSTQQAWPVLLDQLTTAQHSFLSGRHTAVADTGNAVHGLAQMPGLQAELHKAMHGGNVEQTGGCTDAAVRLTNVLKAMAKTPHGSMQPLAKDWVPLFLSFVSARQPQAMSEEASAPEAQNSDSDSDSDSDPQPNIQPQPEADAVTMVQAEQAGPTTGQTGSAETSSTSRVGAKAWKGQLKEWLGFIGGMKGAGGGFRSEDLKCSVVRQVQDTDSCVQQAALRCLKVFKIKFVAPYAEQLQRFAADETLREAMTGFALGSGTDAAIAPQHRADLVPLLIRLLYPKMRKRSGRLGGKGAPGSARSAILNYLAALEPAELGPLVHLFLQPISSAFLHHQNAEIAQTDAPETSANRLFPEPWWAEHLGQQSGRWWLSRMSPAAVQSMPTRQRLGVLNAAHDLLKHLGHKLAPYLPEMCALVLVLLESACMSKAQEGSASEGSAAGKEGARNIRSSALRFWAALLERFPNSTDYNFFWERFLAAVEPQMPRMAIEASSMRAPALLECVAAIAAAPRLVPVLAGQPSGSAAQHEASSLQTSGLAPPRLGHKLMSSALAVLAAPRCLDAARNATLNVVESLLDLEGEWGHQIVMAHVEQLLDSLKAIAITAWTTPAQKPSKAAGQKRGPGRAAGTGGTPSRRVGTRCLGIMERLAEGVGNAGKGLQLADALMPLLQQPSSGRKPAGPASELATVRTLAVLSAVWHQLSLAKKQGLAQPDPPQSQLSHYITILGPLVGTLTTPEARQALSAGFVALSGLLPEMATPARLLTKLSKRSDSTIGEPDYESSLTAYGEMSVELWKGLDRTQGLPLIQQCFWDLRNPNDLALRHAAAQALGHCLEAGSQAAAAGQEEEGIIGLVQRWMFPLVKKGLPAPNLAVRQEHVALLRSLAVRFPKQYADLAVLLDKDAELDFFNNVAHLQLHRRQRALQRLTKVLNESGSSPEGQLSLSSLLGVVAPLLQQFIFEGKAGEDSGHEIKQIDKDREANVTDAAIHTIGALASQLPWVQYEQLLNQWLKIMKKNGTKGIIRAVCAIIDAFHFSVKGQQQPDGCEMSPEPSVAHGEEQDTAEAAAHADAVSAHADIQAALTRRVLPTLRGQLVHDGEVVRAPVALAMVKLLKVLPEQAMVGQLPQTLQGVAHLLRNRLQRIRDDARNVLVAMMAELGMPYLFFAISALHNACPAKGYTAHVLGYTLHAVLETLSKGAEAGAVDGYLEQVLPVMEADLFGEIAEAKEADVFAAKYREAKKCKAYDMFQLLARMITFQTHISQLLAPVRSHLAQASQPKVYNQLASLLQHASRGISANPTATPEDVMIFIHGVLEGGLAQEEAARQLAEAEATAAVHVTGDNTQAEGNQPGQHDYMLVDFALGLFHSGLKKGNLGGQSPAVLALLDPMLPLLVRALRSRHANSVSLALKCLSFLVRLPLPGLAAESSEAGRAVTGLLQRMAKTGSPLAQDCFKLLASLMRQSDTYKPSNAQLRFLLTWAFADVEEAAASHASFGLLKAVLQRKLVVPEVYDVMVQVQELMVRSQAAPVRQACSALLLQFLLDYPVGERRLQQHLNFIITNLSYEHETGREATIDMLKIVISKFPEELVTSWSQVFFLPLVQRLTGDTSSSCREAVGACLKALMQRVSPDSLDKLAQYCLIWLAGDDGRLARTAAQALSILLSVEESRFSRRVPTLLPLLAASLKKGLQSARVHHELNQTEEDDEAITHVSGWQEVYACLLLLEKLALVIPSQVSWQKGQQLQELWSLVVQLLAYPHTWVRKATARLLGLLLATPKLGSGLLSHEGTKPGQLALAVYCQLEADVDDVLAAQAVKCLVHLSKEMLHADRAAGLAPSTATANRPGAASQQAAVMQHQNGSNASEEAEQDTAARQSDAAGSESDEEDGQQDDMAGAAGLTLQGLIRRMVKFAGDRTFHRQMHRIWALKFIAALTTRLGKEGIQPYLSQVMQPLYRIQESGSAPNTDEVKQVADEIIAHIREVAGAEAMLAAYTEARKSVTATRMERKRRSAMQVLVDPEAAARTKIHKQERKAAGRKRKLEDVQRRRGAGLAVKNKKKFRNDV